MTVKLGLLNSEIVLPKESLQITSITTESANKKTRTVNNSLLVSIVPDKVIYSLKYDVISKTNYLTLLSIYNLQNNSPTYLNLIIDCESGIENYSVYMNPLNRGNVLLCNSYYKDVSLVLEEV